MKIFIFYTRMVDWSVWHYMSGEDELHKSVAKFIMWRGHTQQSVQSVRALYSMHAMYA